MYNYPGEYVTDFCIVRRAGVYHLFHIRGERWSWPLGYREIDLGHAVSDDLRTWTPLAPVLGPGAPDAWDATGIWAPDIIEVDGVYHMFYTGSDARNNQAIGLATSSDLATWTKHPHNPLVSPGPWSDRAVGRDVAGRDAMVYHDAERGRFLLYYTATMADGRACMALAQSTDLLVWQDLGPTYIEEDRSINRCESPYLVQQGSRFYLFYSAKGGPKSKGFAPSEFAHFDIVYLIAPTPTGPWSQPPNHTLLKDWTCASEHPTFDGVTYMLYIVQEQLGNIWGASFLSDPRRIAWQPDGTAEIHEHLPPNVRQRDLLPTEHPLTNWIAHGGAWGEHAGAITAPGLNDHAYLVNTLWSGDLTFEAEVSPGAAGTAALLVRANPSALAGYRVSLDAVRGTLGLCLRYPGAQERLLQERQIALEPGDWQRLKVLAQGPCLEVFFNGALQIVYADSTYPSGCFGLHACGPARFRHLRAGTH